MNYENAMKAFLFILGALFITFIFVEDARLLKRIEALEDNNICFIQIKEDRKEKPKNKTRSLPDRENLPKFHPLNGLKNCY